MSGQLADCLFVIAPELYHPHYGYELCTIWPGINGIHGTNFHCGHDFDLATEFANEMNMAKGHKPEYVTRVYESVFGLDKIDFIYV